MDYRGVGASAQVDGEGGALPQQRQRIGILPATCKRGLHALAVTGYRATESAGVSEVQVSCAACAAVPHPDHAWRLATTPPTPAAAELDDGPYAHLQPHFIAQPLRPASD